MKKVKVNWTEFNNYEQELEVPDNLSGSELLDYVTTNLFLEKDYDSEIETDSIVIEEDE